ncbi:dUTP diphosphatase [Methylocystis sp.]|uniref:dUTP diphosphatase n=1 Tax=Methylocystis sp. TaxID=1911079 RepID=UPI00260040F5|nr:dUTP diphosphatase [Methylocystis sp.]
MKVAIRRLPNAAGLPSPAYASEGAAGIDLYAALAPGQKLVLEPGARDVIATGLSISMPRGYEGQIRPRSGLAAEHGVTVLNAPGTIDSDFRGEIKTILINLGAQAFEIVRGMRIAQLVIAPVTHVALVEVDDLDATERGAGGFGSTGLGGERAR